MPKRKILRMKKTFDRSSIIGLVIGFAATAALGWNWAKPLDARSVVAGYVLFSLNYMAIKSISRTLVLVAAHGHTSTRAKLWLSLGSLAKFFGLFGALYLLLVVYELSGFYLALGSLISLLILTGVQVASYLRSLAVRPATRPKS
jgi:hypothetical protein